jgi:hypothetical protein
MVIDSASHSPCDSLAQTIVVRFVKMGHLPEKYAQETLALLSSGNAKPEDWQLLVEKILESESKEGHHE